VDLRQEAIAYAGSSRWPVFPVDPEKKPRTLHGFKDATTELAKIETWWGMWSGAGIGIPTGFASGVWVLDVDAHHGGFLSLESMELDHEILPETRQARTGGGGRHYYFKWPADRVIRNTTGLEPGIDVRGEGGYVVVPPSPHYLGGSYVWENEADVLDAPEWLLERVCPKEKKNGHARHADGDSVAVASAGEVLELVKNPRAYARKCLENAVREMESCPEGRRNDTLNKICFGLKRLIEAGFLRRSVVEEALREAAIRASGNGETGLSDNEIDRTISSGIGTARGPPDPRPVPLTSIADTGLTARIHALDADRSDPKSDAGSGEPPTPPETPGGGEPPKRGQLHFCSTEPLRIAEEYIVTEKDEKDRLLLRRWRQEWWRYEKGAYRITSEEALKVNLWQFIDTLWTYSAKDELEHIQSNDSRVQNVVHGLVACGTLLADTQEPPLWLGEPHKKPSYNIMRDIAVCPNGLLDLATGTLIPNTPDLFVTSVISPAFDPYASPRPPVWTQFLEDLFEGDYQAIELLQEWFGYCLTADTSQQKILCIFGPMRSGKGTVARILQALLGLDNCGAQTLEGLSTNFGLQTLLGKSIATISDARISGKTDQAPIVERLLSISGEDLLPIDRKFLPPITTRIGARILIISNELPSFMDSSGALASRMMMLQLKKSFLGKEDVSLEQKLRLELVGILAWAVDGWRRLRERGHFLMPESSKATAEEFWNLTAPIAVFVEDCCDLSPDLWINQRTVYERWKEWCKESGREPGSIQMFARNLKAAIPGITTFREGAGGRGRAFRGLSTKTAMGG
jgi:putative DNA primase/helicase